MKFFITTISALLITSALYASDLNLKDIKQIVCESTATYNTDTPDQKVADRGGKIFIFNPGSRNDVKIKPNAFVLVEYEALEGSGLQTDNMLQQYYLQPVKDGKIVFNFILDWKGHGEITIKENGAAVGFIDQKTYVTELSCSILTK